MKDEDSVRSMSRTGDPKELLQGTLYYSIVILIVTVIWFYISPGALAYSTLKGNPAAIVIIGCLAGGDGFADIIGRKYGKKKFGIAGAQKSLAGAIGMFFGSFIFSMGLILIFSLEVDNFQIYPLIISVAIISLVATVVESLSPPHIDNITIPIAVIIVIVLLFYFTPLWPFDLISFF
jgi:dolichol kinase